MRAAKAPNSPSERLVKPIFWNGSGNAVIPNIPKNKKVTKLGSTLTEIEKH